MSVSHGVIYRRAQWSDDAKRTIGISGLQITPSLSFGNCGIRLAGTRSTAKFRWGSKDLLPHERGKNSIHFILTPLKG